jgi:class 3 adenylate cyclase/ActR/RegA family two-component response regulator
MAFNGFSSNFKGHGRDGKRTTPRVLVVDDIPANVELVEALLESQGYEVSLAYNGQEALQKVQEDDPDLILLDVMMPGMNGFEVCKHIKGNEETRLIPIVLLTALDQVEDKVRGLDAGADDFLTKPFNKAELLARVRSLLRIRVLHNEIEHKNLILFRLLNRYVNEEIVSEILADPEARMRLGGEKKEVVVLFADIRGFTTFAEQTEAQRVVDFLNECFKEITEVIYQNRGTLDKYVGDCVMAFYGAPIAFGDDLNRALVTALQMQKVFAALHNRWDNPAMKQLGLGIGLNIGEVIVGNIGSERQMDYTVIGDNVNLAQRLEQVALHGQVVISEEVYRRTCHYIEVESMPPVSLKGKREPVNAYILKSIKTVD